MSFKGLLKWLCIGLSKIENPYVWAELFYYYRFELNIPLEKCREMSQ